MFLLPQGECFKFAIYIISLVTSIVSFQYEQVCVGQNLQMFDLVNACLAAI